MGIFDQYLTISETVQDRDIVTAETLIGTCMHSIEWRYFQ